MDAVDEDAQFFVLENRLASFQGPQLVAKRRTSTAASARAPKTLTWPHRSPTAIDLARAGFFFNPQPSNPDNVKCFLCHKDLDGWEEDDDPLQEHLKHSGNCGWAICAAIELELGDVVNEDPRLSYLVEARKSTFAGRWPYESKKGWKCKTKQLAEAGWQYTPTLESDDNTTCAYCQLALDGWEAGDKPLEEHQKRSPNCAFFQLISKYPAPKKATARSKATRTSKVSRLSVQSVATAASDAPSTVDLDDSILTATSVLTQGGRKAPRARKAAATSAAGKARKTRVKKDEPVEILSDADADPIQEIEPPAPKAVRGKKRDSTDVETTNTSQVEAPAAKKRATRKRVSSTVDGDLDQSQGSSNYAMFDPAVPVPDEAVIETELRTLEKEMEVEPALKEMQAPKKGRKAVTRKVSKQTRKGKEATETARLRPEVAEQVEEAQPASVFAPAVEQEPRRELKSQPESKSKAKSKARARKVMQQPAAIDADEVDELHEDSVTSITITNTTVHETTEASVSAPAAAAVLPKRGRGRPSKKSLELRASIESNAASAASASAPTPVPPPEPAAIHVSITPMPAAQRSSLGPVAVPTPAGEVAVAATKKRQVTRILPPPAPPPAPHRAPAAPATPRAIHISPVASAMQAVLSPSQSPQSSDAENQPPSSKPTGSVSKTRIALAPVQATATTPVRAGSPSKRNHTMGGLKSTAPWTAVDVEALFDVDKENSDIVEGLLRHGADLNSPEKAMTVEEFILYNAEQAERQLKQECEAMVSKFEQQGSRAMQTLEALVTEE
ncbi:chromosome segregation protein [Grosmannia clavigera kw1407]|uniref:Chromosome segregation protein n=1 Tax=Grosmannia clavigera (strain kw1407 / UAMH 11150) TaxID=655863 RepID=F0X858_GROCL|nr:chromosome segregation protein [Grosmannia clavigera kw1407]EFX05936.1 chromosome segregation protein [Grosmannia clavigera kw1407]